MQKITVIYFNDESKNKYADLPPNKEIAQRLAKRIYRNAMTALATEKQNISNLLQAIYAVSDISI